MKRVFVYTMFVMEILQMARQYEVAAGIFIVTLVVLNIFRYILLRILSTIVVKAAKDAGDLVVNILRVIKQAFLVIFSLYIASFFVVLSSFWTEVFFLLFVIAGTCQAILCIRLILRFFIERTAKRENNAGAKFAFMALGTIGDVILWLLGILLVLSNLGVNITSLIAGLGIGGVAIALALQNILGDLFSSFAIYLDKPFETGDLIVVGDKMGVVEKIGIKTTRIKALQGEEVVISNKELTSVHIQNFRKMRERRVVFSFGVTHTTTTEKLKKIPSLVKDIIERSEKARFNRAHFLSFRDSALLFEVVYYVIGGNYNLYMDVQQEINLGLKETFEKEKIIMAYPAQAAWPVKA